MLRERLRTEIRELVPGAELVRVSPDTVPVDPRGRYLANIPAQLVAGAAPVPPGSGLTPVRVTLGLAWLLTALAAVMIGVTLHKSIELGERRRRFVSAVTHELRTPLTTFRMYSEMLAEGLVRDEEQRLEYLRTLQDESARLSAMVENVLAHARLEERVPRAGEKLTLGALLSRVMPPLTRQVEASGMTLKVESKSSDSLRVKADVEVVGQILRNLVDNATKYAGNGRQSTVHLETYFENGSLNLKVRDHGPGVPAEWSRAIFEPFDRGGRQPSDPVPGIGLGLALARGLARDLGGDLKLESPPDGGACFHLVLPAEIS